MIRRLLISGFLVTLLTASLSAELLVDPELRIETGFSTARIMGTDVTDDGSIIVSSGADKVLRTWNWDGEELTAESVYRLPIGPDNVGKIYSCAISPDGKWIIAGGWTESDSIYIINHETGQIANRITGLPNVTMNLDISPDGKQVLASVYKSGVYCFEIPTGRELWRDSSYGDQGYGTCWLSDGGCVTTSWDGMIRRYDDDGRLIAAETAPDGKRPFSVAEWNGHLAIGYNDTNVVSLIDGDNLSFRDRLQAPSNRILNLAAVASAQGYLWAGGRSRDGESFVIFSWSPDRQITRHAIGFTDTIQDICSHSDGVIVTGGAPQISIVSPDAGILASREPEIINMQGKTDSGFKASSDGRLLSFGRRYGESEPGFLDLMNGEYLPYSGTAGEVVPSRHSTREISVQGWHDSVELSINGHQVTMTAYETARSSAIPEDNSLVVIGSEWHLSAYRPDGTEIWKRFVPGIVWGVLCPDDAPVVIAAYGDGTIRWHRLSDGEEVLACFPHRDGRRWVAWTPSGYYWAGPGSEDLIGWHVNRGSDLLADYFPASRFRDRFNRPDIVQAVFETWDEEKAVASTERNRAVDTGSITEILPPVVEIMAPFPDSDFSRNQLPVTLILRTPSGTPVKEIRVLYDGREVSAEQNLSIGSDSGEGFIREIEVNLPGESGLLSVIAVNDNGAGVPATRQLNWTGPGNFAIKPVCYVLAIGVNEYDDQDIPDLTYPGADAAALAESLKDQEGLLFRKVEVNLIPDGDRRDVMRGLSWLKSSCTNSDIAVLFLAGHGENNDQGDYYFLPSDTDLNDFFSSAVPFTAIMQTIQSLPGKRLAFLDTCRAGNVTGGNRRRASGNAADQALNLLASAENGCVVFAAATGSQSAMENDAWGHGAFTLALTEALTGDAPEDIDPFLKQVLAQPVLTVNMLNLYIAERVKQLTGGQQHSTMERPATVPDFPIALRAQAEQ